MSPAADVAGAAPRARRVRALPVVAWGYVAWSLVPVLVAVAFSFNDGRSRSVWTGFSLRWWTGDPYSSLLRDDAMRRTIVNSLVLSIGTLLVVTPLGVALAIGVQRLRGRAAGASRALTAVPLVTPEIVVGAALLLTFTRLYSGIPLGLPAQLIGNVTFSLSSVVVIVRSRLVAIGPTYEEAARDLGASRLQALRHVLLPMLLPSVVASLVVVFATVIDDFVITSFLSSGVSSETVPVRIYSSVRGGATPALNALATLLVTISFTALATGIWVLSAWRRRHGERGGLRAALGDLTSDGG
jgi:spermidine/putrescine transport system permease protein